MLLTKRLSFLVIFLLIHITFLKSQNYSVSLIPENLLENADLVVRNFTTEIEMKSSSEVLKKVKYAVTIMNRNSQDLAALIVNYDKNSSVKIADIVIFDHNGMKIKDVKQSEIEDYPAFKSFELYSESRIKSYYPQSGDYPFTIEYCYEISSTNFLSLGYWQPLPDFNVSLEHSEIILKYPTSVKINKKEFNVKSKSCMTLGKSTIVTWELDNLKAIEDEPYSTSFIERAPCVYLMPSLIIYDKYSRNVDNWADFGKWVGGLFIERDELPDDLKIKILALLKDKPDTLEKIRTLYNYIQENTRYVAITMGIGGYQPFDAKTVFQTGYGDCKALSNYLFALLKLIGVKSFPALVSAGRNIVPIFKDFPNFSQFNHMILCVPFRNDTIWLECTDHEIPFGFLGDFTDNRDVLLLTENGGEFAHTCSYNENIRKSSSYFSIDQTGKALGRITIWYSGLQYDYISGVINLNYDEQKKWFYKNSTLPSLQITSFSIDNKKSQLPSVTINESVVSLNYATSSAQYMVLPLNLINAQSLVQRMLKPRYADVLINRSFYDQDSVIFKTPANYKAESIPTGISLRSVFGEYSYTITMNENEITYIRKFLIKEGRYKPEQYKDLYDFIQAVSKADDVKIILAKDPSSF